MSRIATWRRGAAVVEFAVCLPFIFLLIVGSVELSAGLFHQHTIKLTAHQCAVTAAQGVSTADDVQAVAAQIMSQRNFENYEIQIVELPRTTNFDSVEPNAVAEFEVPSSGTTTAGLDEVPRGTILRLTLTAERPSIAGLGFTRKFLQPSIAAECTFVKEL